MIKLKVPTRKDYPAENQWLEAYSDGVIVFRSYSTNIFKIERGVWTYSPQRFCSRTTSRYAQKLADMYRTTIDGYIKSGVFKENYISDHHAPVDDTLETVAMVRFIEGNPTLKRSYLNKWVNKQIKNLPPEVLFEIIL